jgi:ubiquitin-protein ligase
MSRQTATRRFDRGFDDLLRQGCDLSNLQDFWGYKRTDTINRQISLCKSLEQLNTAELTIKINKNCLTPFETYIKELPRDINNVIFSFLRDNRILKYSIHYTDEYPFRPPVWTLMDYRKNSEKQFNDIRNHFDLLYCGGREWSPAITMENEILMYLSTIPWFN